MGGDHYGRRYIKQRDFIEYAKHLGLGKDVHLPDLLEFAERHGILFPVARVRFPDSIVRRWFQARYPSEKVIEPIEPDGERLTRAEEFEGIVARDFMVREELPGSGEHAFDHLADEHREFVRTEFETATFVPWREFRTPLAVQDGNEYGGTDGVLTYYHSWQALLFGAFLRSGVHVLYNTATEKPWLWPQIDMQRSDVRISIGGDRELRTLRENAILFDAVALFEDMRHRALQTHASGMDRKRGRLSTTAQRAYRERTRAIARHVMTSRSLTVKTIISFVQLLCRLWNDAHAIHANLADACKRTIASAIALLRLANARNTFKSILARANKSGGFRPSFDYIFPDWVREQRRMVEASLSQWILPRLANMPPSLVFTKSDVADFCNWTEESGFLQFYWHFRRLTDNGPFDDQIGRSATTMEVVGLATLVEHFVTQLLLERKPPWKQSATFKPKLSELFSSFGPLLADIKKHWTLTQTTQRSLRQQLSRIERMPSSSPHAPALKAVLRLVLIRNASAHGGLPGFRRAEMQKLVESLLIASLVVWKAR